MLLADQLVDATTSLHLPIDLRRAGTWDGPPWDELRGGVISRRTRAPKSIGSKKGCSLHAVAPGLMEPRRFAGSATSSAAIISRVLRLRPRARVRDGKGGRGLGAARRGFSGCTGIGLRASGCFAFVPRGLTAA